MIKTVQRVDEVLEFAWMLCQDPAFASYPRKDSYIELKAELEKAIQANNQTVLACYIGDTLIGICSYFWLAEKRYAQTTIFMIQDEYDLIGNECISFLRTQLPGYQLLIGIPLSNQTAFKYFTGNNIKCHESSIVTSIFDLKQSNFTHNDSITAINRENFNQYAGFHDKHAKGMYYNSSNLYRELDKFRIFAYQQNEIFVSSIFVYATASLSEVFGLFVEDEWKHKEIEQVLIQEMLATLYHEFGEVKEILYFINEKASDELQFACAAGFEIKDRYRCFLYDL